MCSSNNFGRPSLLGALGSGYQSQRNKVMRGLLTGQTKRKIFVSYHHKNDQLYYDNLVTKFSDVYDVVSDNSLDRKIDSSNPEYVMQRIRDNHIKGSSCTLVLYGNDTYKRRYVDWEIKATLDKEHALIGVKLPYSTNNYVHDRFYHNTQSGYARFINLSALEGNFASIIDDAVKYSQSNKSLINNQHPMMVYNKS